MRSVTPAKILTIAISLLFLPTAASHRLDELLQAVQIHLFADHAELDVVLTPGVNLAAAIFSKADTDGDGSVSPEESQEFAARWLEKISVQIDGVPLRPRIISTTFPSLQELSGGEGIVRMDFRSPDLEQSTGHHHLLIRNDNDPDSSIYLENAVVPLDKRVLIEGQQRNTTQSMYTVDYAVGSRNSWISLRWLIIAAGAAMFVLLQKHLRAPDQPSI